MRNLFVAVAVMGSLALVACDDKNKAQKAEVTEKVEQPAAAAPAPTAGQAQNAVTYAFGPANSKIEFKGAKITGSHVGGFTSFKGEVKVNGATAETGAVNLTIDTASIFADHPKLTGHLKSPDFFDVEKYPTATFTSTSVTPAEGGTYKVAGDLTMHGVTKQIAFPATIALGDGKVTGKAAFSINRKDFGLVYPGMPDDLIKDDVEITLDINAAKGTGETAQGAAQ